MKPIQLSVAFLLTVTMPLCRAGAIVGINGTNYSIDALTGRYSNENFIGIGAIMGIMWGSVFVCIVVCCCCQRYLRRTRSLFCDRDEWNGYLEDYCCCVSELGGCCDCCDNLVSDRDSDSEVMRDQKAVQPHAVADIPAD